MITKNYYKDMTDLEVLRESTISMEHSIRVLSRDLNELGNQNIRMANQIRTLAIIMVIQLLTTFILVI